MRYAELGSISSGTLNTADLLDAFASELHYQLGRQPRSFARRVMRKLIEEANRVDPSSENADWTVTQLQDALGAFAPPYVAFGTHEGDGADFGYWPQIDDLEDAYRCGEAIKVNDLADIPRGYRGDVMLVNDHGNVTFGYHNSRGFHEVWSTV